KVIGDLRQQFDDRAGGVDLAALTRLPHDLDVALADFAMSCSQELAYLAGHGVYTTVGRRPVRSEPWRVILEIFARIRDLIDLRGARGGEGFVAVVDTPRPWPSWGRPELRIGPDRPPLGVP